MENQNQIPVNKIVSLAKLKEDKTNIRSTYNGIPELASSIKEHGQMVPIEVDENLEIIDGHRRFRALKELGRKDAWVIQVNCGNKIVKKTRQCVHENQTEKISLHERDQAWYKLLQDMGGKEKRGNLTLLAKKLGILPASLNLIVERVEAKLPPEITNNIAASNISETVGLPREDRIKLLRLSIKKGWGHRDLLRQATLIVKNAHPTLKEALLNEEIEVSAAHQIYKSGAQDIKSLIKVSQKADQIKEHLIAVPALKRASDVILKEEADSIKFSNATIKLSKKLFDVINCCDAAVAVCSMLNLGIKNGGTLPKNLTKKIREMLDLSQDKIIKLNDEINELDKVI